MPNEASILFHFILKKERKKLAEIATDTRRDVARKNLERYRNRAVVRRNVEEMPEESFSVI